MFEVRPVSVDSDSSRARARCWVGAAALAFVAFANAAQVDISDPVDSSFGTQVVVLSNGNFVVTAPDRKGAVFLYSPDGTLISALRGSISSDEVGNGGVTVVGGGSNFVVSSTVWNGVGAATWVDGTVGLDAVVSDGNSLVGTMAGDGVSSGGIVALSNGNYVVLSSNWSNGVGGAMFGAATFGSGSAGVSGGVSSANSLIGTTSNDQVGSAATALANGNYVVRSPGWNGVGAATWGSGTGGVAGPVSSSNSLIGTTAGDQVGSGGVVVVGGGANFVVSSPGWNGVGTATWVDGTIGLHAEVSGGNSLVGTTADDAVSGGGIAVLSNGNYVVLSPSWNNSVAGAMVGAATFGSGSIGVKGAISSGNSLTGSTNNDQVGSAAAALKNGNYVVSSPNWNSAVGAATWGSGSGGIAGAVSADNSLIGTNAGDSVGAHVVALSNGNYVVESSSWNASSGAATWGNGSTGLVGSVSAATSLTGAVGDAVASQEGTALTNGNYVAISPVWQIVVGGSQVGAAMLLDGSGSFAGLVSAANSLTGVRFGDGAGAFAVALSNGNYVVSNNNWSNGPNGFNAAFGAVTWSSGTRGTIGTIAANNSLVGLALGDHFGESIQATVDGNYIVYSPQLNCRTGGYSDCGAVTLASGAFRAKGVIAPWNSVFGAKAGGGIDMVFAYNAPYRTLIVGRPAERIVSLLTMDQVFAGDFD